MDEWTEVSEKHLEEAGLLDAGFSSVRIFGLSLKQVLFLKEFYINHTGDFSLQKIVERTTEGGLK